MIPNERTTELADVCRSVHRLATESGDDINWFVKRGTVKFIFTNCYPDGTGYERREPVELVIPIVEVCASRPVDLLCRLYAESEKGTHGTTP